MDIYSIENFAARTWFTDRKMRADFAASPEGAAAYKALHAAMAAFETKWHEQHDHDVDLQQRTRNLLRGETVPTLPPPHETRQSKVYGFVPEHRRQAKNWPGCMRLLPISEHAWRRWIPVTWETFPDGRQMPTDPIELFDPYSQWEEYIAADEEYRWHAATQYAERAFIRNVVKHFRSQLSKLRIPVQIEYQIGEVSFAYMNGPLSNTEVDFISELLDRAALSAGGRIAGRTSSALESVYARYMYTVNVYTTHTEKAFYKRYGKNGGA